MKRIITDNSEEEITITSYDESLGISCLLKSLDERRTIVLNKREALEVHEFIGEWVRKV